MHVCYVDESGDMSSLTSDRLQPAFILTGLFVEQATIHRLTQDFLSLKMRYHPNAMPAGSNRLDWIKQENKGSDIRKVIGDDKIKQRVRHHITFLSDLLDLVESYGARIVARVYIKGIGQPFNPTAVYTNATQSICEHFNHFLGGRGSVGMVVMDNRSSTQNMQAAHSIFTRKHKAVSDACPNILEVPTYGLSDNHAGIQLADIIVSSIIWPMAIHTYCVGKIDNNIHLRPGYHHIVSQFAMRIKRLQYRYQNSSGHFVGGIGVSDRLGQQSGSRLFAVAPAVSAPGPASVPAPIPPTIPAAPASPPGSGS